MICSLCEHNAPKAESHIAIGKVPAGDGRKSAEHVTTSRVVIADGEAFARVDKIDEPRRMGRKDGDVEACGMGIAGLAQTQRK